MAVLLLSSGDQRAADARELSAEMDRRHGIYLRLVDIWHVHGYPSFDAARKDVARKRAPIERLGFEGKRGRYVRASDLAALIFDSLHPSDVKNSERSADAQP